MVLQNLTECVMMYLQRRQMKMKNELYIPRIIDKQIEKYLSAFGGVCVKTFFQEYSRYFA